MMTLHRFLPARQGADHPSAAARAAPTVRWATSIHAPAPAALIPSWPAKSMKGKIRSSA